MKQTKTMITSTGNPKIKNLLNVKKSSKVRRQQNCFFVEGPRMFFETPKNRILTACLTPDFENKYADALKGYDYELIGDNVCHHICDTRTPQGVAALVKKEEKTLEQLISGEEVPLILVLENLQDPGNVGTIIRTAEAAGVTGIILSGDGADPYQPKVVRSTMGALYRQPFTVVEDVAEAVKLLKQQGIKVFAAHLDGTDLFRGDFRGPSAFLIGNEGNGLTETLTALADERLRIPMKGHLESLNAATAATVVMYETFRQRL